MQPTAVGTIRRIVEDDPPSLFSCGEPALDAFFARHAWGNDRRGIGNTFVAPSDGANAADPKILGFYTLSMAEVSRSLVAAFLSANARKNLPAYPLPVALIGRLAVHERAQRRRIGETLLVDAIERITETARNVACIGIVVDAKNARAEGFYERYGFKTLDKAAAFARRMFMPIDTARQALNV